MEAPEDSMDVLFGLFMREMFLEHQREGDFVLGLFGSQFQGPILRKFRREEAIRYDFAQ